MRKVYAARREYKFISHAWHRSLRFSPTCSSWKHNSTNCSDFKKFTQHYGGNYVNMNSLAEQWLRRERNMTSICNQGWEWKWFPLGAQSGLLLNHLYTVKWVVCWWGKEVLELCLLAFSLPPSLSTSTWKVEEPVKKAQIQGDGTRCREGKSEQRYWKLKKTWKCSWQKKLIFY